MQIIILTMEDVEIYLYNGIFPSDDLCHAVSWAARDTFHRRDEVGQPYFNQTGDFESITFSDLQVVFSPEVRIAATGLESVHQFLRDATLEEFQIIRERVLPSPELTAYQEMRWPVDARFANWSEWMQREQALGGLIAKELYGYADASIDHQTMRAIQPSLRG